MSNDVRGESKTTTTKENAEATGLKEFLKNLATDALKLGEFLHTPETAMSGANLSEADKDVLRSCVSTMVAARLAGVPLDEAFQPPPQGHIGPPPPQGHIGPPPPPYHVGSLPQGYHIGSPPPQLQYIALTPLLVFLPQFSVQSAPPYNPG